MGLILFALIAISAEQRMSLMGVSVDWQQAIKGLVPAPCGRLRRLEQEADVRRGRFGFDGATDLTARTPGNRDARRGSQMTDAYVLVP